jgi:16S rRNA (guanine527-N7)-methyltransferase
VQTAGRAVQILGGRLRPLQLVHIPGIPETRYLVVMEKVAPTPAGYPRRTGIPAKKPL